VDVGWYLKIFRECNGEGGEREDSTLQKNGRAHVKLWGILTKEEGGKWLAIKVSEIYEEGRSRKNSDRMRWTDKPLQKGKAFYRVTYWGIGHRSAIREKGTTWVIPSRGVPREGKRATPRTESWPVCPWGRRPRIRKGGEGGSVSTSANHRQGGGRAVCERKRFSKEGQGGTSL